MTKVEAGRLGGKKTLEVHGSSYMAKIGRAGAVSFHKRYRLVPAGTCDYKIVNRETGEVLPRTLNGKTWRVKNA